MQNFIEIPNKVLKKSWTKVYQPLNRAALTFTFNRIIRITCTCICLVLYSDITAVDGTNVSTTTKYSDNILVCLQIVLRASVLERPWDANTWPISTSLHTSLIQFRRRRPSFFNRQSITKTPLYALISCVELLLFVATK